MPSGWPPLSRSAMRALRPMPVKKISSSRSRAWVSKLDLGDAEPLQREEAERDQEAAGDRVGDVEAAQDRHAVVDRLAEQVGDQAEGDRHEVGELDLRHRRHLGVTRSGR